MLVIMFVCVSSEIRGISSIVIRINSKFPGENGSLPLKIGDWQPFWKLIVWCKGWDVRGRVWAGLSEALTFNLQQETMTWPTLLKERFVFFITDGRSSKHECSDNRGNPQPRNMSIIND